MSYTMAFPPVRRVVPLITKWHDSRDQRDQPSEEVDRGFLRNRNIFLPSVQARANYQLTCNFRSFDLLGFLRPFTPTNSGDHSTLRPSYPDAWFLTLVLPQRR